MWGQESLRRCVFLQSIASLVDIVREEALAAETESTRDKGALCAFRCGQALYRAYQACLIAAEVQTLASQAAKHASTDSSLRSCIAAEEAARSYNQVDCVLHKVYPFCLDWPLV